MGENNNKKERIKIKTAGASERKDENIIRKLEMIEIKHKGKLVDKYHELILQMFVFFKTVLQSNSYIIFDTKSMTKYDFGRIRKDISELAIGVNREYGKSKHFEEEFKINNTVESNLFGLLAFYYNIEIKNIVDNEGTRIYSRKNMEDFYGLKTRSDSGVVIELDENNFFKSWKPKNMEIHTKIGDIFTLCMFIRKKIGKKKKRREITNCITNSNFSKEEDSNLNMVKIDNTKVIIKYIILTDKNKGGTSKISDHDTMKKNKNKIITNLENYDKLKEEVIVKILHKINPCDRNVLIKETIKELADIFEIEEDNLKINKEIGVTISKMVKNVRIKNTGKGERRYKPLEQEHQMKLDKFIKISERKEFKIDKGNLKINFVTKEMTKKIFSLYHPDIKEH